MKLKLRGAGERCDQPALRTAPAGNEVESGHSRIAA